MRARRKPLILADTAVAVSSLLGLDDGEHNQRSSNHGLTFKAGLLFLPGLDISLDGDANSKCPPYPDLPTELKEILDQRCGSEFVDVTILVGLSASALRRLSLTSGSWVKLRDASTSSNRVAKVLVLDPPSVSIEDTLPLATCSFPYTILSSKGSPHVDPYTAYLSPQLAFNLGLHLSCLELLASCITRPNINPSCEKTSTIIDITPFVQSKPSLQGDKEKTTVFRYATHMRIAFIRIPVVRRIVSTRGLIAKQRQEDIDVALQSYFRETRILTKGDIFKVHLLPRSPDYVVTNVKDAEAIYFQVIDLEPSTELFLSVEHSHTALVLSGAVPSQIPPSMMKPSHPWLTSLHADAVYKLASLLAPCLHPKVAPLCLRTSVLLLGQAGCGKRMVTKHAADMLGIHVAEINCFDLVGSSEGKTVTALKQAFQVAQRYSPSVLLLRRFGAFKRAAASGNSLSENIGGLSRIASTLQSCICIGLGILEDDHMISETEEIGDSNMETQSVAKFSSNKKIPIAHGYKDGLVFVVAAAEDEDSVVLPLRRCFTHEIALGTPNENERLECLCHYIGIQKVDHNSALIEDDCLSLLKSIASQTSGFTPRDLQGLAADAGAFAISRDLLTQKTQATKTAIIETEGARCHGKAGMANGVIGEAKTRALEVRPEDIKKAFDCAKLRTASAIGTPKVPNVKWEDVGGLEDVKKAILDTVQLPLLHRELFASGLKQRAGVLLYGPPGTGKTLLAKAVATECSLNFMSVKGPELINMYIGESEKNVREIFQKARAARPCVVFFDELDALAPARGASGDSGGVMDRVVSQMLAEIDGLSANTQDLFIIGASNRPDLIDPALLRPGRFDKLLYVGITSDPLHKQRVLEALTRKFTLDGAVSLEDLARRCPVNFTGADMYALCADSWTHAVKRKVSEYNGDMDVTEENDDIVVVKHEDFIKALGQLTPSLSKGELQKYERLRAQIEGKGARKF